MKDKHLKQLLEESSLGTDQQFEDKLLDLIDTKHTPKKPTIWSLKKIVLGFTLITISSTLGLLYFLKKSKAQEIISPSLSPYAVITIWFLVLVLGCIVVITTSSIAQKHFKTR